MNKMDKPKFDPNQKFEEVKPKFDPNQKFDTVPDQPEDPNAPTMLSEAGKLFGISPGVTNNFASDAKDTAIGLGQGATFGFGDEALGALQATKDSLTPGNEASWLKAYRQHQQDNQKGVDEARERSPWLVGGGELAGGLVPAALTLGGTEGATLAQLAKTGAGFGAVAGLGGSHGTIENDKTGLLKDTLFGAGMGALTPIALHQAGAAASSIGHSISENPTAKKLAYLWDAVKNRGQEFSSPQAGMDIEKELGDTSKSIAQQFTDPLRQSGQMYGQALDEASQNGAKLDTTNPDLMKTMGSVKDMVLGKEAGPSSPITSQSVSESTSTNPLTLGQETTSDVTSNVIGHTNPQGIPGRGGLTPEMSALLEKFGSSTTDPLTLNKQINSLTPSEAKQLQLALRQLGQRGAYGDTTAIDSAEKALTGGIRDSLPEGELNKINSVFGQARSAVEPLVNKGEIDPNFQSKQISDIDPDALQGKMSGYIKQLLNKVKDQSKQGDDARNQLQEILSNLKNVNEKNQVQFADPNQIARQAEDTSMKASIRKAMVGQKTDGEKMSLPGSLMNAVGAAPFKATELAAKAAKSAGNMVESTKLPELSRNIYNATDDSLRGAADKLKTSGLGYLGDALHGALDNKSTAAKNAALFTIMQTPNARKAVFGADDTENQ